MASRRSRCIPVLILATLPIVLGEPSYGDSGQVVTGAPAPASASFAPDRASTALTDSGLVAVQRHIEGNPRARPHAVGQP